MAKASVNKKYSISASGILSIDGETVSLEIEESGELRDLAEILSDFDGRTVKISCNYEEKF